MMDDLKVEICPCCGAKRITSFNYNRDNEIRKLYKELHSLEELSKKYNLGMQRLKQIITPEELRIADRYANKGLQIYREKRNDMILQLHKEGLSFTQISKKVFLTPSRVSSIVKKALRRELRKKGGDVKW